MDYLWFWIFQVQVSLISNFHCWFVTFFKSISWSVSLSFKTILQQRLLICPAFLVKEHERKCQTNGQVCGNKAVDYGFFSFFAHILKAFVYISVLEHNFEMWKSNPNSWPILHFDLYWECMTSLSFLLKIIARNLSGSIILLLNLITAEFDSSFRVHKFFSNSLLVTFIVSSKSLRNYLCQTWLIIKINRENDRTWYRSLWHARKNFTHATSNIPASIYLLKVNNRTK